MFNCSDQLDDATVDDATAQAAPRLNKGIAFGNQSLALPPGFSFFPLQSSVSGTGSSQLNKEMMI